ncbi:MAG: hypothetical protein KIT31_28005 [Deltaproteobacteria bacterium]|nr:hypothetical protein [Deltaproteobacteria bacterium]
MRKTMILVGVWIALFLSTIAVIAIKSCLAGGANAGSTGEVNHAVADDEEEGVRQFTKAILSSTPRKSGGYADFSEDIDPTLYPDLHQALHLEIITNKDKIMDCVRPTINNGPLRTQYLEISFELSHLKAPRQDPPSRYSISNFILERSSIPFTAVEEQCLADAFQRLHLPSSLLVPPRRSFYPLCMNKSAGEPQPKASIR